MPPHERNSPEDEERGDWLGAADPLRARPWVYETLLLGPSPEREQARDLDAVVEELHREREELDVLYRALDQHIARIENLERRLQELAPAPEPDAAQPDPPRTFPQTRLASSAGSDRARAPVRQGDSLARCEGFHVDSPAGPVGFVEGLRFVSRIDRPDLLEVRGGRFGRQLFVIPVEQVEEVRVAEELVLLRSAPTVSMDLLGELVDRVRGALHLDHATP